MNKAHNDFATHIGYAFKNAALLAQALTHDSSTAHSKEGKEGNGESNNEQLEFLGDRVLGLVIADMLVAHFDREPEGHLARRLAVLVSRATCAEIARDWGLGLVLKTDLRHQDLPKNILADGCEAVLGAIYLDGGLAAARAVIEKHWRALLLAQEQAPIANKTALQEHAMQKKYEMPIYEELDRQGPDHAPQFLVAVSVGGKTTQGRGTSIRAAEEQAAGVWLAEHKEKEL